MRKRKSGRAGFIEIPVWHEVVLHYPRRSLFNWLETIKLSDMMEQQISWANKNAGTEGIFWKKRSNVWYFREQDMAVLFKLTWG